MTKKTFKQTFSEIKYKFLKNFGDELLLIDYAKLTQEQKTELDSIKNLIPLNCNFEGHGDPDSPPFPSNEEEAISQIENLYLFCCEDLVVRTPLRDRMIYGFYCFWGTCSRAATKVTTANFFYNSTYENDLFQEKYMGGFFGQLAGDAFYDFIFPLDDPYIRKRVSDPHCPYIFEPPEYNHWTEIKGQTIVPDSLFKGKLWDEGFSVTLCLARSLQICRGFNGEDQLSHLLRYIKFGHCGPNFLYGMNENYSDENFYIENIVVSKSLKKAMTIYEQTLNTTINVEDEDTETLMRILPVTLFYLKNPADAIEYAGLSSQVTHKSLVCRDACRYLSGLLVGAVQNVSKEEFLSSLWSPLKDYWDDFPLCKAVSKIAQGDFKKLKRGDIKSDGFVLDSLNLALSAFFHTNNFEDGFKWVIENSSKQSKAANVYGSLAGSFYGYSKILKYYNNVHGRSQIKNYLIDFHTAVHKNLTEEEKIKEVRESSCTLIYNELKYPHKPPFTFGIGGNYPYALENYLKKRNIQPPPPDPRIEKFKKMSVENLFEGSDA